jgi:hypothetical protein
MKLFISNQLFLGAVSVLLAFTSSCRKGETREEVAIGEGLWAEVLGTAGSAETWTWAGDFQSSPSPSALPAPGYFGYFPVQGPQTNRPPVEMLLLGQHIDLGKKAVAPIGVLRFRDRESGMEKGMVVTVPLQASEKTVQALTFLQFMIEYDALKRSVEIWAQHAPGFAAREILRWEDEKVARKVIEQGF